MFRRYLPKSLYARVVLIVILPIFMMQSVITYVFFARHWELVTANLSENAARQIALVTDLFRNAQTPAERAQLTNQSVQSLGMTIRFEANQSIPSSDELSIFNVYNSTLDRQLDDALEQNYWFNTRSWPAYVEVRVQLNDGVLVFILSRSRVFATTGPIFVLWLVGATLLLGWIAIVFLRNQIRSILRLANAAEAFGRGSDAPDYRPTGATEVRRAGYAFIAMRERIKRHLAQRTSMLAGVSHDLRTPLTRMKLALEMLPDSDDKNDLKNDIQEMQRMVEAYLDFARDEAGNENPETFDLSKLIAEVARNTQRSGQHLYTEIPDDTKLSARRNAVKRAIANLVNNASRHGENIWLTVEADTRLVNIIVEDDGPGLSPENYEDVFRPFYRLDEARNLNDSGMGLGLTVVRDVARSHGGDILLDKSDKGGLRATLRLPA